MASTIFRFFSSFYFCQALVQILYLMFKATKSKFEIIFTDSKYKIQLRCKNDVVCFGRQHSRVKNHTFAIRKFKWHISTSKYILIVLNLSHLIWNLFLNPNFKTKTMKWCWKKTTTKKTVKNLWSKFAQTQWIIWIKHWVCLCAFVALRTILPQMSKIRTNCRGINLNLQWAFD